MTDNRHGRTLDGPNAAVKSPSGGQRGQATGLQLAATIIDVTRALGRSVPPPRGAPYFGLDSEAAYDLAVLDAFCARGIFRKYEFALDLGSGLGGRARWLAARTGCRVVGVDPSPHAVAAAALLNRRARMDEQVRFQVGRFGSLPLRDRVFTHVWLIDATEDAASTETFSEAFRVLRRGGHFAVQALLLSPPRRAAMLAALRGIGFVDLEACDVRFAELPHACRIARDRLRLAVQPATGEAPTWQRLGTRPEVRTGVQIFARRPA